MQADLERARWERIQGLLDALEDVPAAEREDYLARVCPDPELRREVLAMRAVETESAGFLDGFAERLGRAPSPTRAQDLSGRRVGAYRLVQPLGRGGMGVVYEAERADGAFEQRVALKLLTLALAGTEAHGRFLAERQILAGLKHPAISHIVDGGITEDGTPWFAMEHVEGEPIDAYCDRRRLRIRERLELFLQVCDAVEHAHRRLVVHRDLKPANVLVTEDDRPTRRVAHGSSTAPPESGAASARVTPQVKLLDFGIAKLLDVEGAAQGAPLTRTVLRLMTPEYASPEQVRGEPVTTASDVYQLGLLLYELLTGHRPYTARHCREGGLGRAICEQPPTRLSSAIFHEETRKPSAGMATATAEDLYRARCSSPAKLRRQLRGDLENIVLKALSKQPERRYGSADRLAQDIRRHLEGLPVTARSDTWVYRGRRFLERHALGASSAALMLVLATGMIGFYMVRIRSERDRAQAEAAKAAQVSQFLTGLFRSADPREGGAELTARKLLDRGVEQVDRELAGQEEVQADMLHVLGRTYLEMGLYDSAERLLLRAIELRRHRFGPRHPSVAESLREVGRLRYEQGDHELARKRLDVAASIFEESLGDKSSKLVDVLRLLGRVEWRLGEYDSGFASLERALSIQGQSSAGSSETIAPILYDMGTLRFEMGALDQAEALFRRALAVHQEESAADHPRVAHILMGLALVRIHQGKLEGLEAMYGRSLAILRSFYGPNHARVGIALNNLGDFLVRSGRNDEAVEVLQRAVESYRNAAGQPQFGVAYPLATLGDAHLFEGHLREAKHYHQQSVAVMENALGVHEFHRVLAYSLVRLGIIESELGDEAASEEVMNHAVEICRQAPKTVDPELAVALLDLGRWLVEKERCADAVPLLRRAKLAYTGTQNTAGSENATLKSLLAKCQGVSVPQQM